MKNIDLNNSSFNNYFNLPKDEYKYKWSFNKRENSIYNKFDIFVILCVFFIAGLLIF